MSIQSDIEARIGVHLAASLTGVDITYGPVSTPEVEGSTIAASIRILSGETTRLDFRQNQIVEDYAVTLFWNSNYDRGTMLDDWEDFSGVVHDDETLNGLCRDAFVSSQAWGEATDGNFSTMTAIVTATRIEI